MLVGRWSRAPPRETLYGRMGDPSAAGSRTSRELAPKMATTVPVSGRRPCAGAHVIGLVWTLVRTDFKTRYHGTLQGFVWALLKPLTMFFVLVGVFSFIFASQADYRINLIIGLFLWDFFSQGTMAGLVSLQSRGYLLSKARFPSWILVVTSLSNPMITMLVFWAIIQVTLALSGHAPSLAAMGLFAWYLLHFAVMVVAFSLATSVLFLRYRDLNQFWEVALQAGFFVAPIIYPLDILPERFHKFLYLWPPTPVIQFARAVLITGTPPTIKAHLLLTAETAVMLAVGLSIFRRYAPRAAEYV
jgi:lipopolysaccharide transport system permease protein